jgi:hypothetical protein
MADDEIAEMKLKESLLQAMRRNRATGVRVTIKNFVAAAELVKHDQAHASPTWAAASTSASRCRSFRWRGALAQRGTSAS